MNLVLNKADKCCILIIICCALLLYVPLLYQYKKDIKDDKEVVVNYKNKEVLRVPLNKNKIYHVDGTLGKVTIEILDGSVRVEKEESPLHLCSIQGWVNQSNRPIVCLPNHIIVVIESKHDGGMVDTVIQ